MNFEGMIPYLSQRQTMLLINATDTPTANQSEKLMAT